MKTSIALDREQVRGPVVCRPTALAFGQRGARAQRWHLSHLAPVNLKGAQETECLMPRTPPLIPAQCGERLATSLILRGFSSPTDRDLPGN